MNSKRYLVFVVVVFLLFSTSLYFQLKLDRIKKDERVVESLIYLPSGKFLKPAALGFDELLADLLWIKAVTYFGGHYLTDKKYDWLYHILDIATTLDPRFEYPYEFGGTVLSIEAKQVDKSISLLKKGIDNHPKVWRIPFLLGFNHFFYLNDYKTAADYISRASLLPNRPNYLPSLAARLYAQANAPEVALLFLEQVYENTEDERMREEIRKKIKEVTVERDIVLLERAARKYEERYGTYPESLNQLVSKGILRILPKEPFDGRYFIDDETREIRSSTMKERMRVYRKMGK